MQQLNIQSVLLSEDGVIEFSGGTIPQQQVFIDSSLESLQCIGAKVLSKDTGADRAQIHFVYDDQDWLFCFEATCEAIWIEPVGAAQSAAAASLMAALKQNIEYSN